MRVRRAVGIGDQIVKGRKPGVPIEQATKFRLVVNLKSAKSLGIEMLNLLFAAVLSYGRPALFSTSESIRHDGP